MYQNEETDDVNEMVEIIKEEPHVKWDCESIIS